MKKLTEITNFFGSDKGTEVGQRHSYSLVYEKIFEPIRNNKLKLLEIGVNYPAFPGASLKIWQEYFPNAKIFGFDITDCRHFENERVKMFRGDQGSEKELLSMVEKFGANFDIIIDDGSHNDIHQQFTFSVLFKYLSPGGVYIIEDLDTHNTLATEPGQRKWLTPKHGYTNKTLLALKHYLANAEFVSDVISNERKAYLVNNIDNCEIWREKLAVITKKKTASPLAD